MAALALSVLGSAASATTDSGNGDDGPGYRPGLVPPDAGKGMARRGEGEPEKEFPTLDWYMPEGPPKAIVITIHGGSWFQTEGYTAGTVPYAMKFTTAGAAALNIDFRTGLDSITDVVTAFDTARAMYPKLPICAYGWSAGGNLALILAKMRKVDCVIAEAAPTNIYTGSQNLKDIANYLFPDHWKRFSPALRFKRIDQPTLLVSSRVDELVPHTQAKEFKRAVPAARLIALDPGHKAFFHSDVDAAQLNQVRRIERSMVANAVRRKG